ncbi:NmrA family NAD(P)-binding protein [Nonomuraea sp. NPDC049269]|uniref:NmrA family NAD(P)-binding protein n=1 Tax=Nonomuraea sp. NPDC049269 TaxID=3364349 RepID=UPI0037201FA0
MPVDGQPGNAPEFLALLSFLLAFAPRDLWGGPAVSRVPGTGEQAVVLVDGRTAEPVGSDVAYVRDPGTEAAKALAAKGARLATGDLADTGALTRAAKGMDAVFGITVPIGENGAAEEISQGRALTDAAAEAGAHLIYSSVRGAASDADFTVDHASAKQVVQRYITEQGVHFTGLQPVYFMESALNVGFNRLNAGVYAFPLSAHRKLDQVTVLDIAGLAVHAIENPEALGGRSIDIVSDSVTSLEAAEILAEAIGKDLPYESIPIPLVRQWAGDEIADMLQSFEDSPVHTDITALHAEFPGVRWHSFRDCGSTSRQAAPHRGAASGGSVRAMPPDEELRPSPRTRKHPG